MSTSTNIKGFLSMLVGVFVFAFITQIDQQILVFLYNKVDISSAELYRISQLKVILCIFTGAFIAHLVTLYEVTTIAKINLGIFLLNALCVMLVHEERIISVNMVIMVSTSFSYFLISVMKIIGYSQDKNQAIAILLATWILGAICGDSVKSLFDLDSFHLVVILNILSIFFVISTTMLYPKKQSNIDDELGFTVLMQNVDLQNSAGFLVGYVAMSCWSDYDLFAIGCDLAAQNFASILPYCVTGIFICLLLWSFFKRFSLYNLCITSVVGLPLFFVILSKCGKQEFINLVVILMIGFCLCMIFIANISTLFSKFEDKDLQVALSVYFVSCSIGCFVAQILTNKMIDILGKYGFLFSIYSIIFVFLVYYIYGFVKRKLYRY